MDFISLLALATALAMDAFAVALAAGALICPLTFRPCFRLAFHFGLFQGVMPVLGWLAGRTVQHVVAAWSHWLAFILLLAIGLKMIVEALTDGEEHRLTDPSRGLTMVMLAVATSIDALVVGLTLAMVDVTIWRPSLVIGLVAALFTLVGLLLGCRVGNLLGRRVEVAGGVLLIVIGLKILVAALLTANSV